MDNLYSSIAWRRLRKRALKRDGNACSVSRLFGGACDDRLDVHHLIPVSEGGDPLPSLDLLLTVCHRHHPMLERLRRELLKDSQPQWKHCRHRHYYAHAKIQCELRLNKQRLSSAV